MDFIFDPSLVLYLPLYELDGASIMSKDKHGHLCTVTGALWRPYGRCFDGSDDKIVISDAPNLRLSTAFTLETWVKPSSASNGCIMSKHLYNGGKEGYWMYWNTQKAHCMYVGTDLALYGGFATTTLSIDTWYHFASTYDGNDLLIYVNASLDKTYSSIGVPVKTGSHDLWVGRDGNTDVSTFPGFIGEVRIYNRGLSPLEIQHNYLATKWRYR